MHVFLIDGTYELFRYYYAVPSARDADGAKWGQCAAWSDSVLGLVNSGVTHIAVATDHVIESFRNRLWRGYKTSAGIDPDLLAQFHPLEDALRALGVVVWPMVEFEADDALASGAELAARDARVERVVICTPDKDLGQSVRGTRVVQLDRRRNLTRDEAGVVSKFGVPPGVDSRLPGARRRRRRRLSRTAWLGRRSRPRRCSRSSAISRPFRKTREPGV